MKKKLLFIIPSLAMGGAEKSLVNLLSVFDYAHYDVDLFLLQDGNELESKIPKEVNFIKPGENFHLFTLPLLTSVFQFIKRFRFRLVFARIAFTVANKIYPVNKAEQYEWKYLKQSITPLAKQYDIAVGYLEKTSIYLCVDLVSSKFKSGFIRADYNSLNLDKDFDRKYFKKLNYLCANGYNSSEILRNTFPEFYSKIKTILNVTPVVEIERLAEEFEPFDHNQMNIVSVGRLQPVKGFEICVDVCKLLIKRGNNIIWHIVGEGPERENLEKLIEERKLQNNFILHGQKDNPYPYIKNSDIFVQTSRFEGRSNTIIEAKIMLKPIVVTNFNSSAELITNGKNGIIVNYDPNKICESIEKLLSDSILKENFINNLRIEKESSDDHLLNFYELING